MGFLFPLVSTKENPTNWFQNILTAPSAAEKIICDILKHLNIEFRREISFKGLKYDTGYYAKFDFLLVDFNICIEYDGEAYHSSNESIRRDMLKDLFCKRNKIKLVRYNKKHYYNLLSEICSLCREIEPAISPFQELGAPVQVSHKKSFAKKQTSYKQKVDAAFRPTPDKPALGKKGREKAKLAARGKSSGAGFIYPHGMSEQEYLLRKQKLKNRGDG